VDPGTFTEVDADYEGEATLAVAAYVGTTRLIDNMRVTVGHFPAPVESPPVSTERGRWGAPAAALEPPDAGPGTGEIEMRGGAQDQRVGGDQ
jgi:pantoate--beta-alanine ligase